MASEKIEEWRESLKKEERRIRDWANENNLNFSEEKIKFIARGNVGHPPDGGWK